MPHRYTGNQWPYTNGRTVGHIVKETYVDGEIRKHYFANLDGRTFECYHYPMVMKLVRLRTKKFEP
jgi:hypothetical protein